MANKKTGTDWKTKGIHVYPTEDGGHDHYAGLGYCKCKPVPCWDGFVLYWYHSRIHTEQNVIEHHGNTTDWN